MVEVGTIEIKVEPAALVAAHGAIDDERGHRDLHHGGKEPRKHPHLAAAAGMSISGTRTAYGEDEIAEVAGLTGTRPRRAAGAP